jgi:hypothetical protein
MALLKLQIDSETMERLVEQAVRERRPITWEAEVLLRQALGLPFPYAGRPASEPTERTEEAERR